METVSYAASLYLEEIINRTDRESLNSIVLGRLIISFLRCAYQRSNRERWKRFVLFRCTICKYADTWPPLRINTWPVQ